MLFSKRVKRGVGIVSLACFLCSPISYGLSMSSAAAATGDTVYAASYASNSDRNRDRDDRWNRGDRDNDDRWNRGDRPNRGDDRWNKDNKDDDKWSKEDRDKWEKEREKERQERQKERDKWEKQRQKDRDKNKKDDDGKDYSRGDITTAVLIGGVIGAIIAKNT